MMWFGCLYHLHHYCDVRQVAGAGQAFAVFKLSGWDVYIIPFDLTLSASIFDQASSTAALELPLLVDLAIMEDKDAPCCILPHDVRFEINLFKPYFILTRLDLSDSVSVVTAPICRGNRSVVMYCHDTVGSLSGIPVAV